MDFSPFDFKGVTQPIHIKEATHLMAKLKKTSRVDLQSLLGTSDKLTDQSIAEIKVWQDNLSLTDGKIALRSYDGDVYGGLDASSFNKLHTRYAAETIYILSGLYGLLRGTDLILPHRLDISASLATEAGKTLYPYWKSKITVSLQSEIIATQTKLIINLTSDEYAKAVEWKDIDTEVIHFSFLDEINGKRKVISFNAKKARGMMARMVILHKITKPKDIQKLEVDGYRLDGQASSDDHYVYVRG
jgi:uncharacterized protein